MLGNVGTWVGSSKEEKDKPQEILHPPKVEGSSAVTTAPIQDYSLRKMGTKGTSIHHATLSSCCWCV